MNELPLPAGLTATSAYAMFSASYALTLAFAIALVLSLLVKFWLASRQIKHVAQHSNAVPIAFSSHITLAAHQKAAAYTIAKGRLGLLEMALGSAALLAWTLLGGLSALNEQLMGWIGGGMAQQVALLATFVLIGSVIDLPITLYQTFVLEERFGFNKMTFKLWLADLIKSSIVGALIGLPIAALILWLIEKMNKVMICITNSGSLSESAYTFARL